MYKKLDLLMLAGECWDLSKTNRQSVLNSIATKSRDIIRMLDEQEPYEYNALTVLQFVSLVVAIADDNAQEILPHPDFLPQINRVLNVCGYTQVEGNWTEVIEPLSGERLQEFVDQLVRLREHLEPNYYDVVALIFSIAILQANNINETVHHLATVFADDEFDILPNYQDFLLDF